MQFTLCAVVCSHVTVRGYFTEILDIVLHWTQSVLDLVLTWMRTSLGSDMVLKLLGGGLQTPVNLFELSLDLSWTCTCLEHDIESGVFLLVSNEYQR